MTTRAALKTEILDDLERDASADGARVLSAISAAIKHYQPKRFFFNESRSVTFSTEADKWQYTFGTSGDITTEFYRIDAVFVTENGNNYEMCQRDYREMELLNDTNATTNRPYDWAYIGQSVVLYPVPDGVYTVRLTGHIKAAEPAADDTAGNVWFTEAYELIRCRAKSYLYAHVYPDPGMAQMMQVAEASALRALRSATMDRVSTGNVEPTSF